MKTNNTDHVKNEPKLSPNKEPKVPQRMRTTLLTIHQTKSKGISNSTSRNWT
jgi:hypothetical protein